MIYNTTATPEWVRSMNPDALVIAVGAEPVCPPIPGIEKAQEATSFYTRMDEIVSGWQLSAAGRSAQNWR